MKGRKEMARDVKSIKLRRTQKNKFSDVVIVQSGKINTTAASQLALRMGEKFIGQL
jgi:hypothetical protein